MSRSPRFLSPRPAVACAASLAALLAGVAPLAAFEPTPPEPSDTPPEVTAEAEVLLAPQLIVKYVDAETDRAENLTQALASATVLSAIAEADVRHVRLMSGNAQVVAILDIGPLESLQTIETLEEIAERIEADPSVEYAEPNVLHRPQQAVNDPQYGQQWHYTIADTSVDVEAGWALSFGSGVRVAVVDTGFRPHADLMANLLPGYDFIGDTQVSNDGDGRDADASDPGDWVLNSETWCPNRPRNSSWHGTHVAGTVSAVTNNGAGVAGVARGARVVPVRVLGKCGGYLSDISDGMRWAAGLPVPGVPANANPAQVINLSLGGSGACGPTYQDAIDDIVAAGVTVVVAAGNSAGNAANFRPANCDDVITVAATNRAGGRSYYSNFGATVEVSAPGGETFSNAADGVLSTLNTGTQGPVADSYAFYQGTSMATPHVAAVAALLYQLNPSITPAAVLAALENTAQPFPTVSGNQCDTSDCGAGIVDAGAAAASIGGSSPPAGVSTSWLKLLLK